MQVNQGELATDQKTENWTENLTNILPKGENQKTSKPFSHVGTRTRDFLQSFWQEEGIRYSSGLYRGYVRGSQNNEGLRQSRLPGNRWMLRIWNSQIKLFYVCSIQNSTWNLEKPEKAYEEMDACVCSQRENAQNCTMPTGIIICLTRQREERTKRTVQTG